MARLAAQVSWPSRNRDRRRNVNTGGRDLVWLTPVARSLEAAMTANCGAYDHRI
jgi:hypothetical protein